MSVCVQQNTAVQHTKQNTRKAKAKQALVTAASQQNAKKKKDRVTLQFWHTKPQKLGRKPIIT